MIRFTDLNPRTGEPTNAQRAEWARLALDAFCLRTYGGRSFADLEELMHGVPFGDDYTAVQDLLTDLMHVADQHGWNFAQMVATATSHHAEEVTLDNAAD